MYILDFFGNAITVTNLQQAIEQTKCFVGWSESQQIIFDEFKLVQSQDIYGIPTKIKRNTNSGKSCTNLEYYEHQLRQLQGLNN